MITLDTALAAYAQTLKPLPAQAIPTPTALHRVLAAEARAQTDLPRFDQSALDGYALRSADTAGARTDAPVELPVALTLPARGSDRVAVLPERSVARILTGAQLPTGADAMIPQERAERVGDHLRFTAPYPAQRNVRWRGEELQRGAVLALPGQRIGPGLLASLINADVDRVEVRRAPRLRVFVTGDEIRPAGTALRPGEIHDSNGPLIAALLATWGLHADAATHLRDDETTVRLALADAFATCDLVISTGGASVGDKDYLPAVAEALGARRVFWKVAQKPGKPMFFGVVERGDGSRCAMLALPGNPGAVLVGMLLHVRTALDVMAGLREPGPHWQPGVLAADIARDEDRTRLVRMELRHDDGCARLLPLPHQDSHMLSNLGRADVVAWIDAGPTPVPAGTRLRWLPLPA